MTRSVNCCFMKALHYDRWLPLPKAMGNRKHWVDAVVASNSPYITATKTDDGSGILAPTTQQELTSGKDPTVNGESYSAGLSAIEAIDWNVLAVDTDDTATHAVVQTYIDRVRNEGKRVIGVVGEPTSVALAIRRGNSRAFNDPAIIYVANGFKGSDGIVPRGVIRLRLGWPYDSGGADH